MKERCELDELNKQIVELDRQLEEIAKEQKRLIEIREREFTPGWYIVYDNSESRYRAMVYIETYRDTFRLDHIELITKDTFSKYLPGSRSGAELEDMLKNKKE